MDAKSGVRRGDLTTRWVELVVALLIVLGGAVVIIDSLRVGISWAEDGPRAGYFPLPGFSPYKAGRIRVIP